MNIEGDCKEKTFDYAPPRETLIPAHAIKQVQDLKDGHTLVLTIEADYHITEDINFMENNL